MQLEVKTIKKHFQKSIDTYSENAFVQKVMADKLAAALVEKNFESILEVGSGAGILTKELSECLNFRTYCANDLVEKSEFYVKKYIPNAQFSAGDFRRVNFRKKFDLIISNAVFQWCGNLDKIFAKCSGLLNENSILAFSTFLPDNFKEFYSITGLSLDYKSVEDIRLLLEPDFDIISIEQFEYKMTFDNPLRILAHLKNTGVNSLSQSKWGIKEVKAFCDEYRLQFPETYLTYVPLILTAKKRS